MEESSKSTDGCDLDGSFFFYSCSTHTHKHTHTEHLLSVVTTQTDIASVKYNLDLKGE